MKKFYFCLLLICAVTASMAQNAPDVQNTGAPNTPSSVLTNDKPAVPPAPKPVAPPVPNSVLTTDTPVTPATPSAVSTTDKPMTAQDVKLPDADSLEYHIRNDYLICTGDTVFISREKLFAWKKRMDSLVLDKSYSEKFKTFVSATGIKAHRVRPCEPVVFFEQIDRQMVEMDSLVSITRRKKERDRKDSITLAAAMKDVHPNPADIPGIPAGISRDALRILLVRNGVRTTLTKDFLRADSLIFDSLAVTAAFYFDRNGKYIGYEMETAALKAEQLDKTVRGWANRLSGAYEKKLGAPSAKIHVGFRDIKQGRLSIISKWTTGKPTVLVGLAAHNNLYYAKVMVNYK